MLLPGGVHRGIEVPLAARQSEDDVPGSRLSSGSMSLQPKWGRGGVPRRITGRSLPEQSKANAVRSVARVDPNRGGLTGACGFRGSRVSSDPIDAFSNAGPIREAP
jgi:hypothetical protein